MTTRIITFLIMILSTLAFGQTGPEKEIASMVEKLRVATIDGNEKALMDLTAPELSYGHSSGKIEDQKAFIGRLVSGDSDFKSIDISDMTIKIVDNTAIVRHKLVAEAVDGGQPTKPNLSVLLVWQKQKGQWKLLARQAVKNL